MGNIQIQLMAIVLASATSARAVARAEITTVFEFDDWQPMVGEFSTIDFTGFEDGTPITDEYADMGVTFTDPAYPAFIGASNGFENDGWGLHGPSNLRLFFHQPQSWIAVHHSGNAMFEFYLRGELQGVSDIAPVGGFGSFLGAVSTVPFDEVIITKPTWMGYSIGVDDLHWGEVPAPGALSLLLVASVVGTRRRRSTLE